MNPSCASQGGDHFAGGEIPQQSVVDAHESDCNGDAWVYGDLHLVCRLIGNMFAVFKQALHHHVNDGIDTL